MAGGSRVSDLDDPDDAYQADDPVPDRLINFAHRLQWILDHDLDPAGVRQHLFELLDDLATMRAELVAP
jgi:hypothetical protein